LGTESGEGLVSNKKKEDEKRDVPVSTGLNCSRVGPKSGLLMERAQAVAVVMASLKLQILAGAVAGTN